MSGLSAVKPEDFLPLLRGADYCEAFLEDSQGSSIRFEDSRVEDLTAGAERGIGLRFLRRNGEAVETLQGSSNSLEPATARRLRDGLFDGRPPAGPGPAAGPIAAVRHPVRVDPASVPMDEKIALLRRVDATVRGGFPHIRQVSLSYAERRRDIMILNSDGARRREQRVSVIMAVNIVAEKNGILQTGMEVLGGLKGYELLEDSDPVLAAQTAARRALAKLSAPKAKAGEMPIVISSSAGGTFIHEAIGHSLEMDHVLEGSSPH